MRLSSRTLGSFGKLSVLVVLLVVFAQELHSAQVAHAAAPPTGFRNFKWGAAPSGKLKKLVDHPDGTTLYVPAAGKQPAPLYGLPVAEEAFMFSNGKFFSGSAWLKGKDTFDKMKATLEKEFGKPAFANESINLWKWKWAGSQVEVHLSYQSQFAKTTVTFVNNGI